MAAFTLSPLGRVPEKGYVNVYGRDVTQRRRTEEALRASEKRYRSFIEVTGELGWTTDAEGGVVEDIPTFRQFTGQSYEEVKGWGWSNALHPDDLQRTTRAWREAVTSKRGYEVEYRLRRHDGVFRHFLARGMPVFAEDGAVREWVGTCVDITERKEAEEVLRKSDELLKLSQEIAHLGSWELDLVKDRLFWSDEVYQLFGLKPQEFGATYEAFLEGVHPDDRAAVDAAYSGSVKEGKDGYEIEHRIVRKSTGEIRYVYEKCQHVKDGNGKIIRSVGMVHDITERKLAEEKLVDAAVRYRTVADNTYNFEFWLSPEGQFLYVSPSCERIYGYPPAEFVADPGLRRRVVHPDDLAAFDRHLVEVETERAQHEIEFRILHPNGTVRWIAHVCQPVFDEHGRYLGVRGSNRDITERRQAEEALREAHDYLDNLLNYANAPIIVWDPTFRITLLITLSSV